MDFKQRLHAKSFPRSIKVHVIFCNMYVAEDLPRYIKPEACGHRAMHSRHLKGTAQLASSQPWKSTDHGKCWWEMADGVKAGTWSSNWGCPGAFSHITAPTPYFSSTNRPASSITENVYTYHWKGSLPFGLAFYPTPKKYTPSLTLTCHSWMERWNDTLLGTQPIRQPLNITGANRSQVLAICLQWVLEIS